MQKVIDWSRKNHAFIAWAMMVVGWSFGMYQYLTHARTDAPPLPPPPPPILAPAPDVPLSYSFGWAEDKDGAEAFAKTLPVPEFSDTPAGQAILGDASGAQLWKAVEEVWKGSKYKNGQPYPNVNQASVGCCCGAATKHTQDTLLAVQCLEAKRAADWRPFAVEPAYANSRVVVLQRQIRGDGSTGFAMAQAVGMGNLAMEKQPDGSDLTVFDPMRARSWGNSGVPGPLVAEAAKYKTPGVARVKSWDECKKALAQDYPVLLTSNQGFEGRKDRLGHLVRDDQGFLAPGGSWPHAMALIGFQTGAREGGFILNSWGDGINVGPVGAGNPPTAGFWADSSVINKMCQSGDCWVFSKTTGFPPKKLRWKVRLQPRPLDPFSGKVQPCDSFSLAF